jgi:hypothetical protein
MLKHGVVVDCTAPSHLWSEPRLDRFNPRKDLVLATGGWVGPGPVWMGEEKLSITVIRSPDGPARSESLYCLSYPLKMLYAGNLYL